MEVKNFQVGFFCAQHGDNETEYKLSDYLNEWLDKGAAPAIKIYSSNYEIRNLSGTSNGKLIRGEFAKYRDNDIPHIGEIGGDEREIDLNDGEGLIEKNHFLFYSKYNLFVYQQNRNGSTANQLALYFTDVSGETTTLNPLIKADSIKRLMSDDVKPKTLEISYARPTNSDLIPKDNWSNNAFGILSNSGGVNAKVKISLGQGGSGRYLKQSLKKSIKDIMNSTDVRTARFEVEENGTVLPIDLIADRIKSSISVKMDGRYPNSDNMYQELGKSFRAQEAEVKSIFGIENALA